MLGTPAVYKLVAKAVERELTGSLSSTRAATKTQARAVWRRSSEPPARGWRRGGIARPSGGRTRWMVLAAGEAGRLPEQRRRPLRAVHRRGRLGAGRGGARPHSEFQALLPIRGKILNVQEASVSDILRNAECALDHPGGRRRLQCSFGLDSARYGKIIFMADADSDGAQSVACCHRSSSAI